MAKLRKMLGQADSPYIVSLMELISTQSKTTLVSWSVGYAEVQLLPIYEKACPGDTRPRDALAAARAWMAKEIKLPQAKAVILGCHEAAREADDNPVAQAAARAVGQAAATIHAPTHSLGVAFYGAAATAYDSAGLNESAAVYDALAAEFCARLEAALQAVAVPDEPHPAKINWNC